MRDKEILAATPEAHPGRHLLLQSLVANIESIYQQTGVIDNIEQFISYSKERLAGIPSENIHRFGYSNDLGILFFLKYQQAEVMDDLQQAISYTGEALVGTQFAQKHPMRSIFLNCQATNLYHRYQRTRDMDDLQRAISYAGESLDTSPPGHPRRVTSLDVLASCFRLSYERSGDMNDINRENLYREEILAATPLNKTHSGRLVRLSESLSIRYKRTRVIEDLNRAIWCAEEGIEIHIASQSNLLSGLLSWRYEQTGDSADLERAIKYAQDALEATPEEISKYERAGYLTNLANTLHQRYDKSGEMADLRRGINFCEQGRASIPEDHPDRVGHL